MSDIDDILRSLRGGDNSPPKSEKFNSPKDAAKLLEKFLKNERDYEVGDFVERNEFGIQRYALPKENQVCKVVYIREDHGYNTPQNKGNDEVGNNVVLAAALAQDTVRLFEVDGRFYRKAREADNVTFLDKFKKKGK